MSVQVEYRVTAKGSTDAADQAKALARRDGYRVQTVASIRPALRKGDGESFASPVPGPNERAPWVVALAVRR